MHWQLRHACPACTYVLEDEPPLEFSMLIAMDGNESLKCMDQAATTFTNTEQKDFRVIPSDMYLPADKVNIFKYEVKSRHTMLSMVTIYFTPLLNFFQLA